ncbi:hypothetical protein ILUMI_22487, partial [Ignelater luminosus]
DGAAQNTDPSLEANALSLNGNNNNNNNATSTLPPLTEILGGRTVMEFNNIVNQTNAEAQTMRVQTLEVDPMVQSRIDAQNVEINTISSASSSPPPPAPASSAAPSSTTTSAPSTTTSAPTPATPLPTAAPSTTTSVAPPTMPPSTAAPSTTSGLPPTTPSSTARPSTTTGPAPTTVGPSPTTVGPSPTTAAPTTRPPSSTAAPSPTTPLPLAAPTSTSGPTPTMPPPSTAAPSPTTPPSTAAPTTAAPTASPTTIPPASPTTQPPGPPTTQASFTTPLPLSISTPAATTATSTATVTAAPATTALPRTSTTARAFSTTFFPVFFSTLLSTLQPQQRITTVIPTTTPPPPTTIPSTTAAMTSPLPLTTTTSAVPFTSPSPGGPSASPNPLSAEVIIGASRSGVTTPTPPTTLIELLTRGITAATPQPKASTTAVPTTVLSTTIASLKDLNLKQRQLTEQQKKDLAILEALEKEQEAILQQLAFLTGLNLGATSPPKEGDNLADRVLAMAMGKLKNSKSESASTKAPASFNLLETLSPKDSRQSKSVAAAPSIEELVKQISANGLNSVTPAGPIVTSTYGKTNDALLASLLKEYGVGPATPKVLSNAFTQSTTAAPRVTTTKRSVTTQAPGRLMQGLNWLLNALAPQPSTKRPPAKPRASPKPAQGKESLNTQPTEIVPVVVASPDQPGEESKTQNNIVDQKQLVTLIKQLEEIQKDPKKARDLDLEVLKTLQSIERPTTKSANGIQVITASSAGTSSRSFVTTAIPTASTKSAVSDNEVKPLIVNRGRGTTALPLSVSNNILENVGSTSKNQDSVPPVDLKEVPGVAADIEAATTKSKIPPVQLNPVPGIPDGNPRIRGQLVNYAINVTKAISSFLGSALQGASNQFVNLLSSGSGSLSHFFNSSSNNTGNILSASSFSG